MLSFKMPTSLLENKNIDPCIENENTSSDNDDMHVEVKQNNQEITTPDELASKHTLKELKEMCKRMNIQTTGDKKTLATRIVEQDDVDIQD